MNRWLAGQVFWPLTEQLLGRDTLRRFRELLRTQRCSADEIHAIQTRKLRRLLRSADAHCPFYTRRFRDAGLEVNDPHLDLDCLNELATLTKADIRSHLAQMSWPGCPGGLKPYNTGGSSGEPLQFHIDRLRTAADTAARLRARTWWQVWPGDPEVLLWGAPIELKANDRLRKWRDALLNQYVLNAFDLTDRSMDEYIASIHRRRPACLYGYPSSIALLARHALRRGLEPGDLGSSDLRAIFVTGEVLLDRDREAIASAFGGPVVIEYGCRDGGLLALGCEAGSLHVPQENVIVELLDAQGRPVAPSEVGEVTVTHLEAVGMPIIRYRTGDEARLPAKPGSACACGRSSQTLAEVRGRVTDHIVCRAGGQLRRMHALALIYVLREAEGVRQFRIVQPSIDRLEVAVAADERFTPQVRQSVEARLRQRLGPHVAIDIHCHDRIAAGASGKHAYVISHVPVDSLGDLEPEMAPVSHS
jgi:phenylacetate-CoA ligase